MSVRSAAFLLTCSVTLAASGRGRAQEAPNQALLSKCKADLAARLEVTADEVKVTAVEDVTWPDASLGCPRPGMDYTMALVPGYRVVLEVAGRAYEYHTDKGTRVVYCEQSTATPRRDEGIPSRPPAPTDTPVGPEPPEPVVLALEPIPGDPNGNSKLVARRLPPAEGPPLTVLERCTDFAVAEDGLVLAKRRTSRSGHELVLVRRQGDEVVVMKGFDFEALSFVPAGTGYFYLARETVGSPFRMYGGELQRGPVALEWAPELQRADGATVDFLQNLLVLTVPQAGDGPEREVLVLDIRQGEVLARFQSVKAAPALSAE